jgi:DNA-binding MurR/RpiR family transcriptional regulator
MKNDILNRINQKYASMSKGQKRLSAYLTDQAEEAAFMTAAKLGDAVSVSESTVIRFASYLGYKGFSEFQTAVRELMREKMDHSVIASERRMTEKENAIAGVMLADIERIRRSLEMMDERVFMSAVDLIANAKSIYLIGVRESGELAEIFGRQLKGMFPDVRVIANENANRTFEELIHITEQDVLIAISFPRYSFSSLRAVEFANSRKAGVVTITDSVNSPLNLYSSCNLIALSETDSVMPSMTAALSLINAMVSILALKRKKEVAKTMKIMDEIWKNIGSDSNDEMEFVEDTMLYRYDKAGEKQDE